MKTIFFGTRKEEQVFLESLFSQTKLEIQYQSSILHPDTIGEKSDAEIISIFVDSKIDGKVFDAFPNLKYIAIRATGYDNVDLVEASKRNVIISNVPAYGVNTVAEFAFGLILSLSRKIYLAADQVKETGDFSVENLRGFDLLDKTIGIIGTGRIGQHVMKIAKGFGMKILAYDPYPNEALKKEVVFDYVSLDELLSNSDVVSLHVPYSKETHHLINEQTLSKMKKNAVLINTSRGGIVDTNALVRALNEKRIAGAGLDVLEEEGVIKNEAAFLEGGLGGEHNLRTVLADHALVKMQNVIITPHNAFNTDEALRRILVTTHDNIEAFLSGKTQNVIKS